MSQSPRRLSAHAYFPHLAWAILGLLVIVSDAEAYIDPGTGSLAYQAVLAAILGGAMLFRHSVAKIVGGFRSLFGSRERKQADPEP